MTAAEASTPASAWLLVDAVMVRSTVLAERLHSDAPDAVPLYADLGDDARSVGPWLLPIRWKGALKSLPLPASLGVSELLTTAGARELVSHFRRIRFVRVEDGQRFYFRFADTRALQAANAALPNGVLATIKGPVARWNWVDRYGRPCELAQGVAGSEACELTLTANQLDALLAAGAADQMAVSLEELGDPGLVPTKDAQQFMSVEASLAHCDEVGLEPWLLRRAVARRVILSGGAALRNPGFRAAVLEAKSRGISDPVDVWGG